MRQSNKIHKHKIALILFMLLSISGYAQDSAVELLKSVESKHKNLEAFHTQVVYSMFNNNSDTASESYTGYILKKEGVIYIKLLGAEVLQFPEVHILVDNDSKILTCSKSVNSNEQDTPLDVSKFLKLYTIASETTIKNTLILNMNLNKAAIHIPYKKISLFINKNTLEIEKQVLYFSGEFDSTNIKQTPEKTSRLEVVFKGIAIEPPPKLERYVTITSDKKITPSTVFAGYKIIDQTHL
nr:hypothetical protein [Gaetbulibacter sp. 4G1]